LRDWWTNSTVKAFDERAQCIARQYSKYYVLDGEGKKVYVNGNVSNHIYQAEQMLTPSSSPMARVSSNGSSRRQMTNIQTSVTPVSLKPTPPGSLSRNHQPPRNCDFQD
jgi:hypothetical protein